MKNIQIPISVLYRLKVLWRAIASNEIQIALTERGEVKGIVISAIALESLPVEVESTRSITDFVAWPRYPSAGAIALTYRRRVTIAVVHPRLIAHLDLPVIGDPDLLL